MAPKSKATKVSGSGLGKTSAKRKSPTLSNTTRLECIEGSSSKFWEISVDTNTTTVVFGKIGDAGRSTTKVHKDKAAALKFKEKQVATKVKGGYTVADGGRTSTKKPKTEKPSNVARPKAGKKQSTYTPLKDVSYVFVDFSDKALAANIAALGGKVTRSLKTASILVCENLWGDTAMDALNKYDRHDDGRTKEDIIDSITGFMEMTSIQLPTLQVGKKSIIVCSEWFTKKGVPFVTPNLGVHDADTETSMVYECTDSPYDCCFHTDGYDDFGRLSRIQLLQVQKSGEYIIETRTAYLADLYQGLNVTTCLISRFDNLSDSVTEFQNRFKEGVGYTWKNRATCKPKKGMGLVVDLDTFTTRSTKKKHTKAELESPTVESIPLDVPFVQRYLSTYVFPEPVVGVFNYTSNDVNEWNWDRRPSPCRECGDDECECGDGCGYDTEGPLMWSVKCKGQSFILLFFGAAHCGDSIGSYNTIFDSKSKEIMRIDVGNGQDCTIKDDAEWSSNAMKKKYLGFMTQMEQLLTTYPF